MIENTTKMADDRKQKTISFQKKVWIAVGIISLATISLLLFKTLFNLLLLVLAGILMAVYFHGCASFLNRLLKKISKTLALIIAMLINFIFLIAFFWFMGARLNSQVQELSETLPHTVQNAKEWITNNPMGSQALDYATNSVDSIKASSAIQSFFSSTFGILSDFYIIILLGLFFTSNPAIYRRGFILLIPPREKKEAGELWDKISVLLRNWLKGQIFGFFFIAILSGLGLWALGMPLILTLALIAGLLNFIPNFGPIIALIPAVLLALMQSPETALYVVALYTGIQIIQSAVTQPLIQKKMVNMPPGVLIFGQVGMGVLTGFWGVLLATPLVAILMKVINELYVKKQK